MCKTLVCLWALAVVGIHTASAQVELEPAFPNLTFSQPVDIQHPGDGTDRLFVVEKPGVIRVFANDVDVSTASIFLDIQDRVDDSGGEMGLLGLAFHPQYETNGQFFVNYTAGGPRRTVIARFSVDPGDPNGAEPGSEVILLEVDQPFGNHNAGQIQFGPEDGYLYFGLGDGGSGGDPEENGQDRSTLLGSMLRIDVDAPAGDRMYGIPPDNPLVGADCGPAGCREEIWAYGFRNPWRFSFDPHTGRLWLGDVGQGSYEEIDIVEAGGNYGWDVMEGAHCYEPGTGCDRAGLVLPVWEYDHGLGFSVTGGYVYRGSDVPELVGRYVFGDYGSGRIWMLPVDDVEAGATQLMDTDHNVTTFGVDAQGELYVADYATTSGVLYRFVSDQATAAEDAEIPSRTVRLDPVRPNPFRQEAVLSYSLDRPAGIVLAVYDVRGRLIRSLAQGMVEAGPHEVRWDGRTAQGEAAAPGVYLGRLLVDGRPIASQRMVRLPE